MNQWTRFLRKILVIWHDIDHTNILNTNIFNINVCTIKRTFEYIIFIEFFILLTQRRINRIIKN